MPGATAGVPPLGRVRALHVYPVKGLSAQPLERVVLRPGEGVPGDRRYALARADGRYRPGLREGLPKQEFHALVSDHRLAGLDTHLDAADVLTVRVAMDTTRHEVLRADLRTEGGRRDARRFFARVLDLPEGAGPEIAHEPGRRFTDAAAAGDGPMGWLSLVNLASVRDLGARTGTTVDPGRFRANVLVDGLPPWSELDLVDSEKGQELRLGGARVRVVRRTRRCAATEVDPATGVRDLPVVRLLDQAYGHQLMGVYLEVLAAGTVEQGDELAA